MANVPEQDVFMCCPSYNAIAVDAAMPRFSLVDDGLPCRHFSEECSDRIQQRRAVIAENQALLATVVVLF
jgi:hypothetical protein